jgi:hypothetical protein
MRSFQIKTKEKIFAAGVIANDGTVFVKIVFPNESYTSFKNKEELIENLVKPYSDDGVFISFSIEDN